MTYLGIMSALINALDNTKQYGQNGHVEYSWNIASTSNITNTNSTCNDSTSGSTSTFLNKKELQDLIVKLSFQLVRTENMSTLASQFKQLLQHISKGIGKGSRLDSNSDNFGQVEELEEFTVICKLVAQTRDIVDGKGEYSLSYMLIYELYQFFPEMAQKILSRFFSLEVDGEIVHPYGSWKDVKYFCKYVLDRTDNGNKKISDFALNLMVEQLKKDALLLLDGGMPPLTPINISLAGKWCPRESCKRFGQLYTPMATIFFKQYIDSAKTPDQLARAILKCKMDFRKLLSRLNKELDTIQIKQCANTWTDINHSKTTSITGLKQKKALLNVDKKGVIRSFEQDRVECSEKYKAHFASLIKSGKEMKGKRIGLNDFTVQAIALNMNSYANAMTNQLEKDMLNSQWRDNAKLTNALDKVIPLVDVSGSMVGDPLHAAIALGIRVAEKSLLGKRVLTFSENPEWHDLSKYDTFTDSVASLQNAKWGMTTNFYLALDLILGTIVSEKLPAESVEGMILAIFSDMQMNTAMPQYVTGENVLAQKDTRVMYEVMTQKYAEAGIKICGQPYKPPHILFWNLRSTSGFPVTTQQENVTMFSGFSPALLNNFCEKGIDALKEINPWTMLLLSLDKERYNLF
jgi:hypothetical protein